MDWGLKEKKKGKRKERRARKESKEEKEGKKGARKEKKKLREGILLSPGIGLCPRNQRLLCPWAYEITLQSTVAIYK